MSVSNENVIRTFIHCGLCAKEKPKGVSLREWASLEVGWTKEGLQVWCKRHECNVVHIDFQGCQHPGNDTRKGGSGSGPQRQ